MHQTFPPSRAWRKQCTEKKQQITPQITDAWHSMLSSARNIKLVACSASKEGLSSSNGEHVGRSHHLPTQVAPLLFVGVALSGPDPGVANQCLNGNGPRSTASLLCSRLPWSTYRSCISVLAQADPGERGSCNCSRLCGRVWSRLVDLYHYWRFVQQKWLKRVIQQLRHHIYLHLTALGYL